MSGTFTVGCRAELTVAVTLPPSAFTATANVVSKVFMLTVTAQSPMKGAACSGVIDVAAACRGACAAELST